MNSTACRYSLQECQHCKSIWLRDATESFPEGCHVRIVNSDESRYVGLTGVVTGYDLGSDGDWPLISVTFDDGVAINISADGFYDDELEPYDPGVVAASEPGS